MTGQTNSKPTCPSCGAEIPPDAPQGYCIKCLFALGTAGTEDGSQKSEVSDQKAEAGTRPNSDLRTLTSGLRPLAFGDYELLEEIARGGMGIIYRARQKSLGRIVAVKMLLFGDQSGKEQAQRFRAEAALAASLQHPNIVAIHEVSAHEGRPFFVMDFIDGQSLARLAAGQPLPAARAVRYVKIVAEAIHYAHERGILHRDLKPSNVLIDPFDQPRVTDFGLAKRLHHDSELTLSGQVLGSPNYMPPEQAAAKRGLVGRRSDVYSLGAILYHLLTGRPPFVGETLTDTLQEVVHTEPVSPRLLNPSVPRDLETLCLKCLEKEPARRYQTAQALAEDLDRFLKAEPIRARRIGPTARLWRWCRRKPLVASLGAATLVLLVAVAIGSPIAVLRIDRARKLAEVRLYAADMFAAQQAFENGNLGRARDFLKAHWPLPGESDLRGFEWRYLWNLCRGDNFHTLPGHSNVVRCVAFSPDGKTVASGSADSSVKLWDVANRRLVSTLPVHTSPVAWLAFSNDGQTLATVGDDGLIKLWNVKTHQLIFTLKEGKAARVAFSPVGTLLAIGYGDPVYGYCLGGPMKLWDYVTHQVVKTFPEPGSRLAFSPDGRILAARSDNDAVKLWNVETGEEMRKLDHAGEVICLSFSPDGKTVATGNWAGDAQLWNVGTGARESSFKAHAPTVWSLAFLPDGKMMATVGSDQTVRLWNVATGKEESKLIGHGSEVWAVAVAPDGQTLATGGKDAMVMLWSTAPKRAEVVIRNVSRPPTFSPDNKLLATWKFDRTVTVWNVATRQPVWVLDREKLAQFANEGNTLATITTNSILRFWDVATRTPQRAVPLFGITDSNRGFRVEMRGNRLAAADENGFITLFEATTGVVIGKFKAHADAAEATFSPDARLLATSGEDQLVKLWDVATQKELANVSGHKGSIQGLAFSPDGSVLASACWDDTVGFLRVATGKAEAPLTGIKQGCSGVAFSPDGRTLAVACEDGTVRLWNLATRREVAVLRHGKAPLRYVLFSPDGQTLVSVGQYGALRFWEAPNPDAAQSRREE